jgi:hypothetical protein
MRMPGFTATASLGKTDSCYRMAVAAISQDTGVIEPSLFIPCHTVCGIFCSNQTGECYYECHTVCGVPHPTVR